MVIFKLLVNLLTLSNKKIFETDIFEKEIRALILR